MAKSKNNHVKKSKLEDKDVYRVALDTRNFEISLFWERSNYFLVLNSALALGFFNLEKNEYAFLLAIFGLFASFLWYRVNLGSKYWQSRWESRLAAIERRIAPNLDFFSADWKTIGRDVEDSLKNSKRNKRWFQKWLDKQILKKPSVSYNMTLLSLMFLLGWMLLITVRIWKGIPLTGAG